MKHSLWRFLCPALRHRAQPAPHAPPVCGRGYAYWWGHDTIEDQEKRRQRGEENKMVEWKAHRTELDKAKKYTGYLPARIKDEAEDYFKPNFERLNKVDYYSYARQPYFAYWFDYNWWVHRKANKEYNTQVQAQLFNKERVLTLGPDLAAAYFIAAIGGRIRFVGHSTWTELDSKMRLNLPREYQSGWHLEAIDTSATNICYEGLQNVRNLLHLRYLDVSYSPLVDDFVLNRIVGEFSESLELLDISGCIDVNFGGIECLWRLKHLKTLVLYDMDHIADLKLICVMLLEIFPDLDIRGVDYIDSELLKGTEHEVK